MDRALASTEGHAFGNDPNGQDMLTSAPAIRPDALETAISRTKSISGGGVVGLRRDQKAAVIIRLMQEGRQSLPLGELETGNLAQLVRATSELDFVSEADINAVVGEFVQAVNSGALYFRPGLERAMASLSEHLDDDARAILLSGVPADAPADPWIRIAATEPAALAAILAHETPQVCGVVLSKLPSAKSAQTLAELEPELARAAMLSAARSQRMEMQTVVDIGAALAQDIDRRNDGGALSGDPVERVGAILNFAPSSSREDLLAALQKTEPELAKQMRKTMFTFTDIPDRIDPKDVAKIVRGIENETLITALAGGRKTEARSTDFILSNLSKRLTEQLGEEIAAVGSVKPKDADAAMSVIIQTIRDLEANSEIILTTPGD
ncbi:MAG: FliG C-terminal domain-containing protein [Paracoccaceae bacterium]